VKIAIITELFLPSIGGQELRLAELAEVLTGLGHSVDVFCIQNMPETESEEVRGEIRIHRRPRDPNYQQPGFKWFRRRPFSVLAYALWCRQIDPSSFDFFILNEWPLAHIALARRELRSKAVIDWCEFRNGTLFWLIQKYVPRLTARNMANSVSVKCKLEGISGCHFELFPSGVVLRHYRNLPAPQRQGIVYVGRVTKHKDLELLLSSYESLVAKGYRGRLRIAGSGPALGSLRESVQASSVTRQVDILGAINEQTKIDLLATSELLVLTSRREGFPRIVAEAMASGLPVITADYPENGAKEIVMEYGIGKVTMPTAEALTDGMLCVMKDWNSYSSACRLAAQSLDWDVLVPRLLQIADTISKRHE
jgi:glycosyltransferase involved in cell wall biosynthesis